MATVEECQAALEMLVARLADVDPRLRQRHAQNRTVAVRVPDLGTTFHGVLRDGLIDDIRAQSNGSAQIVFTAVSDDLVAVLDGRLGVPTAVASGRLKVDASLTDLLKLRLLL